MKTLPEDPRVMNAEQTGLIPLRLQARCDEIVNDDDQLRDMLGSLPAMQRPTAEMLVAVRRCDAHLIGTLVLASLMSDVTREAEMQIADDKFESQVAEMEMREEWTRS